MELKVIVPTSLSEITLDQYQRFARLEGDEEFLTHKMLEIFCGVPLANLPNVRIKDVSHISKHISAMINEKPNLTPTFTMVRKCRHSWSSSFVISDSRLMSPLAS